MGISFLSPWRLLLLFVVVALGSTYALFQKRRSKYAVRFTNLELLESIAPNRPGWRRHIAAAVQLVALSGVGLRSTCARREGSSRTSNGNARARRIALDGSDRREA